MPAMAILIGILIEDMAFVQKAYTQKYARDILRGHIVVIIAVCFAGGIYVARVYPQLLAGAIMLGIVTIVATVVSAVLIAIRKPAFACGATFVGIVVLVMIAYVIFVNPLNYNQPSRRFTQIVVEKVPDAEKDKLVAYKSASTRFIHYFGRPIPEIKTKSEVDELYNQSWWVVAFGKYLDELLQDGQFEIVFMQENAERHKGKPVDGALFHKSVVGG
jgi:hypothetical protein